MSSRLGTRAAATVAALVGAATGLAMVPSVAVAAPGRCAPGDGVTVVVDFGGLGGGTPIVCVPDGGGRPAMSVVRDAGFDLDEVRTMPGFVCAINTRPDPAASCARTPPASAFWGLFSADGSSARWTFSTRGAGSLTVPDGGSIGWRWQNGGARDNPGAPPTTGAPSSSPEPSPSKPPESPKPTPKPTQEPAATAPATPGTPSASAGTSAAAPSGSPTTAQKAAARAERAEKQAEKRAEKRSEKGERAGKKRDRKTAAKADREVADDEQVTSEAVVQEETPLAPSSATGGGGGALTWVAGGAVLLLAGAAGVLARRRRG